jgi:hypothetical protein
MLGMKRFGAFLLAGVVSVGLLACQRENAETGQKVDKILAKLDAIEKKLDTGARPGAGAQPARPQRPPPPDPKTTFSVPIDGDPAKGAPTAKVTIVEAAEFA